MSLTPMFHGGRAAKTRVHAESRLLFAPYARKAKCSKCGYVWNDAKEQHICGAAMWRMLRAPTDSPTVGWQGEGVC